MHPPCPNSTNRNILMNIICGHFYYFYFPAILFLYSRFQRVKTSLFAIFSFLTNKILLSGKKENCVTTLFGDVTRELEEKFE